MADLYGKINRDIVPMTYEGVDTETAETIVDNKNKTIKVNVIGDTGSVRYDEVQHLTEKEKEIARDNIGAGDIYENLPAEQGGEDFSLVTTGEKYDWDNKQDTLVNQSNIKSVNGNSLLGSGNLDIRTYQEFGNSWVTNETTQDFCESIRDDVSTTAGMAYLGKISCSDLPGLVQGECVIEIISNDVANGKNIHLILTSVERSPYRWEYSYCKINGSYTSTDWIGYQTQLISGTSIKTINNNSLLGSGNLNIDALFYCTYGTTTYAQITQALSDRKLPVCIYNDRVYSLASYSSSVYRFGSSQSDYIRYITVNDSDVWAVSAYNLELATNKVTSISSSSTDTQYPSAKCVYDYAQPIIDSSHKLSSDLVDDTNNINKFVSIGSNGQILGTYNNQLTWVDEMTDDDIDMLFIEKGTILKMNLDGTERQYRVIKKVGGSVVEVISMANIATKQFTLNGGATYKDEVLDSYLNDTLYATFSETAKSALVDKTFTQDKWDTSNSGDPDYSGKYGTLKPGTNNYTISLVSSSFGVEITRHIYVLSVQDILDYILDTAITDGELQNYNIWKLFWNDEVQHTGDSNNLWLRSAQATANAMFIDGTAGRIWNNDSRYSYGVRPAFQIDLSKITYTEV